MKSLGPLLTKTNLKKQKWQQIITLKKLSKSWTRKEDFQNCSKLAFFSPFQISNPNIFVIFCFSHKKIFSQGQTNFCFSKTNSRLISQIQTKYWTPFGEGGKKLPPSQKWKVQFCSHCRKTRSITRSIYSWIEVIT